MESPALSHKNPVYFAKPTSWSCMPCSFAYLYLWEAPLYGFPSLITTFSVILLLSKQIY